MLMTANAIATTTLEITPGIFVALVVILGTMFHGAVAWLTRHYAKEKGFGESVTARISQGGLIAVLSLSSIVFFDQLGVVPISFKSVVHPLVIGWIIFFWSVIMFPIFLEVLLRVMSLEDQNERIQKDYKAIFDLLSERRGPPDRVQ